MAWMTGFKSTRVGDYSQYHTQNSSKAQPVSNNPMGTGGVTSLKSEADHSVLSIADSKNMGRYCAYTHG
jgi:hypothetical protein